MVSKTRHPPLRQRGQVNARTRVLTNILPQEDASRILSTSMGEIRLMQFFSLAGVGFLKNRRLKVAP